MAIDASSPLESRIVDLEVRISFQDATIEALSGVVNEQQQQITALQKQIEYLKGRLDGGGEIDPAQVKPPHY